MFWKKDINIINLNRLREVQDEIRKLNEVVEIPQLKNYCTSTSTFCCDMDSVINFIGKVLAGERSPCIYTNKSRGLNYSESEVFWTAFEKYCHDMKEYCTKREENIKKLNNLKFEEEGLKRNLCIK